MNRRLTDEEFARQQTAVLARLTMRELSTVAHKECVQIGQRSKDAVIREIVRARLRRRDGGR